MVIVSINSINTYHRWHERRHLEFSIHSPSCWLHFSILNMWTNGWMYYVKKKNKCLRQFYPTFTRDCRVDTSSHSIYSIEIHAHKPKSMSALVLHVSLILDVGRARARTQSHFVRADTNIFEFKRFINVVLCIVRDTTRHHEPNEYRWRSRVKQMYSICFN